MLMRENFSSSAPTAIGGLGGSGTRVFAALLQEAGVYIGDCLNAPLDNLWFTVLFKRAQWGDPDQREMPKDADVATSIRLFQQAMTQEASVDASPEDIDLLHRLRADLPAAGKWKCGARAHHADSLLASLQNETQAHPRWGWKEPNTHIFLPYINRALPNLRYIHIVRDGLDMAFSKNTWQARHWGHLFGCVADPDMPLPAQQLRFWTAANRSTLNYGRDHMAGRFLVIQYEDFCARPKVHWTRILQFLGLPDTHPLPDGLVSPSTIGRSETHDLSVFSAADLVAARKVQSLVHMVGRPD